MNSSIANPLLFAITVLFLVFRGDSISAQETEPTTSSRYQEFIQKLMLDADIDQDGLIDEDEAKNCPRAVFQNADLDQNGLITTKEILSVLSARKQQGKEAKSIRRSPKVNSLSLDTKRLTVTVLHLPSSFAQSQVFSLKDIYRKISVQQLNKEMKTEAENSIKILDQMEFDISDGNQSKIRMNGTAKIYAGKQTRNGRVYENFQDYQFGTSITVKARMSEDSTRITADFDSTYLVKPIDSETPKNAETHPMDKTPISISFNNVLEFTDKKDVSAVNMLVSGYHLLVLFKIDAL